VHGCIYCYTRGYTIYPGENKIVIYRNLLDKIEKELARKRKKPRTVYFSPSSDPFQPVPEVLDMAYDIFALLLEKGIGVSFLTKGRIPAKYFKLFEKHKNLVSAGIGIISSRDSVLKTFEPRAASAGKRLENMKTLVEMGVFTQTRLDPILPGVTDSLDEMGELVSNIGATGIRQIAASVLFLRPAIQSNLKKIENSQVSKVLSGFNKKQRLGIHASKSNVIALPQVERRNIYDTLNQSCKKYGIEMKICACKNPDLAKGTCSIAGIIPTASAKAETGLFPEITCKETGNGKRNPS
jgi:DNA repair photolyase